MLANQSKTRLSSLNAERAGPAEAGREEDEWAPETRARQGRHAPVFEVKSAR